MFLVVGIIVFLEVLISDGGIKFVKEHSLQFIIVSTSIVAGSFFIIRTYIKSEINITETNMSRYFADLIQKISDKSDANFQRYQKQTEEAIRRNEEVMQRRHEETIRRHEEVINKAIKKIEDLHEK